MMKSNALFTCSCVIFILLMSACSQVKYAHLNKIPRQKQITDQQFFVNELKEKEKAEIIAPEGEQPLISTPFKEVLTSHSNSNKEDVKKRKKETRQTSKALDTFPSSKTLPVKVFAKIPEKLKTVFSKKANIADASNTNDFSIFWAIVAALVVFWGLGWALSGSGIVHVLIVIAIVLVLLRLVGIFG